MAAVEHLTDVVAALSRAGSYRPVPQKCRVPLPSIRDLEEAMQAVSSVLFPGFYADSHVSDLQMPYYIGVGVDKINRIFSEQIKRGFCFSCEQEELNCRRCEQEGADKTSTLIQALPTLRDRLALDAQAAYEGDPAARTIGETIFCYPSIQALIHHRVAHELYRLEVPLIPRIIAEMAHSRTGIDIHPGATIGDACFMDHGTGIVIGETCVIGRRVRIYQGVTLGAKSFSLDETGKPIKGILRHPIIEDDVTIYSGATILGRVTMGRGSVIGGNVWLTEDVPPQTLVMSNPVSQRPKFKSRGMI
jgi:serine O-acetyltransferase